MIRLLSEELTLRPGTALCPDCPMPRVDVLASMIPPERGECAFRCLAVRARAPLPTRWFGAFGFGVVRRGIVIRRRLDAHGRAIAVDAIGAGGLIPMRAEEAGIERGDTNVSGYAVTDVLICACSEATLNASMDTDPKTPRDLLRLHSQAIERMERLIDARGRTTVVERVAAMLCALVDSLTPFRQTDAIADLQQSDLAALVSARQETVCRALRALERRGLVSRDTDGYRIADRHRLEAV